MKTTIFSIMFAMFLGTVLSSCGNAGKTDAADTTAVDSVADTVVVDTVAADTAA